MGEVAMSSGNGVDLRVQETGMEVEMARMGEKCSNNNIAAEDGAATAGDSETVRWERFLPKMVVRVLLVEADDSTRQIISALLRKCSYRVAAVGDGLKAWEILKGRSHNIDLILTEVDLPSISGYALLSLIMEHEVCKNIPVIMMSSQDSVSTVYKCMLRGATDFLVKPVRKNELRNLWQHVWRKQASSTGAGLGPPDESVARGKDEASAENNAASNHSSETQSSCTRPEPEDDGIEHIHSPAKPENVKCVSDGVSTPGQEECHQQNNQNWAHESETEGLQVVGKSDADNAVAQEEEKCEDMRDERRAVDIVPEIFLREAMDLIGTFDNHFHGSSGTCASISSAGKFDILPMLDLSLRRSHHSDERTGLNHSDASAFSRYINKPLLQKDHEMNIEKDSDTRGQATNSPSVQTEQPKYSYSQNRDISHPIPVRGVGFGNVISPSTYPESFQQPNRFFPSENQTSTSQQLHSPADQRNSCNSADEAENKQGNKFEEHGATNQSGSSSFCNGSGNTSHHHSQGSGCNNGSSINAGEESFQPHEGASSRAMQREAALTKFRQKRKDRCFEKKVRYESRKKLAEQRPRVKGQFVRQLPADQPVNS